MRLKPYSAGIAIAALLATSAMGQNQPSAAGTLDPAAEQAPVNIDEAPDFQIAEGVIVTVNDHLITSFDLRQRMLLVIAMTQVQPTPENLPAIQRQALNALIDERLQMQELARFEVNIDDASIDDQINRMAQGVGLTGQGFLQALAESGIRAETLRSQLRAEIGWRRLVNGRFNSRARVGRAQVEQVMRRQAADAARTQYLIGEIFIDASRVGGQTEAANGANQLVQQLLAGAPFQAVARQFSTASSAAAGGDAGWVIQGESHPALESAFSNMEPGQLSRPIPVEDGVWIIYMRDKRTGDSTSVVSLKQVMIELPQEATAEAVTAATQRLEALRPQLTCDNLITQARAQGGMIGADLGESDVANLAPQFQQIARSGEVGSISNPVRTPLGLHLVALCGKRLGGPGAPTFDDVENRLMSDQLAMLERRYIRDLRADAAIEMRN